MNFSLLAKILQIVLSISLTILVLIQSKSAGLSYGLKSSFSMYRSLRGVEKLVFYGTVVLGVALVANSFLLLILA